MWETQCDKAITFGNGVYHRTTRKNGDTGDGLWQWVFHITGNN